MNAKKIKIFFLLFLCNYIIKVLKKNLKLCHVNNNNNNNFLLLDFLFQKIELKVNFKPEIL
jgi:hypothetical protein